MNDVPPTEPPEMNPNDECEGEWRDRTPPGTPEPTQVLECSGCGTLTVILWIARGVNRAFEFPAGYTPKQAFEAALREARIHATEGPRCD